MEKKLNNELPQKFNSAPKIIEYLNTKDASMYGNSSLPFDKPIFEALPPVIVFSDFEALKVKTRVLKLRNLDSVTRRVKIVQPETNLFRIAPINQEEGQYSGSKVAPGLETSFLVKFSPETKSDYKYDLTIITEREKFVVPIVAIGKRALIDFPDVVDFGPSCPVKYNTEKPVIIHNKGEKPTKWEIKLPEGFDALKKEGVLEEGRSEQLILKFFPVQRKLYRSIGKLLYDNEEADFELVGNAINGEVYISRSHIRMEETYISLESRETFKIVNKSTVAISFQWRAFSNEKEEYEKKKLLLDQLEREEAEKRELIYENLDLEDNFKTNSSSSEDEQEIDEKELLLKKRRKAEMQLERKYKTIRRAIEEDTLVFEDEIFTITPIEGTIWPNSEMAITVVFKPRAALKYNHKAYCNISCSDERLPIYIEGEGLGPKAFLSTNNLSIGDVYVNETQNYSIYIENKGEIPARFRLLQNETYFSQMFHFDIEEAELAVGQRMNILMTFQSSKVGEFQEIFKWKLEGSTEVLSLLVRGHVRAPKFELNRKEINYRKVSFQFQKTEEIVLTNTSTVPFTFGLRIPQDGKGSHREFEIVPSKEEIQPNESKKIKVKFIPHFRKVYKAVMVLDIENIGKDIKSIPITAESDVPKVKVGPDVLDFGTIFLRYAQTQEIELINESNLFARFIVHPLNPKFASLGKVVPDLDKGQISPNSSIKIALTLTTSCIKNFEIDLIVEIVSDTNTQHLIKIKANSIGPIVELSHKELDFGDVDVLGKAVQKVTITNRSVIEADFYAFTKSPNSIFKPVQKHYILKPEQAFDVEVLCVPDDTQKFADTLYFVIKEGVDKEVQLKARGVGTTIFCKDIKNVSFGVLHTHRPQIQEVFLENKGRKTQTLRWQRKADKLEQDETTSVFSIYPESVVLLPKTGLMFQFKAFSPVVGKLAEVYSLSSAVGTDRKTTALFSTKIEAEFVEPTLVFSKKSLSFTYNWQKDVQPEKMSQNLSISCPGPLPINFSLYTESPFTVSPSSFSLLPKKSCIVKVEFDPSTRQSRVSNKISERLHVKHLKHPKNETYELAAEYCFPNLSLSTSVVDFGAVMNDTSKKCYIVMTNTSSIVCEYEWHFVDEGHDVALNEVFDILPLRGVLDPGVEEKIEFSYYAVPYKSFHLTAVCKVVGGPDYFVKINAEASDVAYSLAFPKNKNYLDYGDVPLNHKMIREFEIENTSKVVFDFSIRIESSGPRSPYMKEFIKVVPSKSVLQGGERIKIKVAATPIFPSETVEYLVLQVAHFEPERIAIRINGVLPSLRVLLPRKYDKNILPHLLNRREFDFEAVEFWEEFKDNIPTKDLFNAEKAMVESFVLANFEHVLALKSSGASTGRKNTSRNSQSDISNSNLDKTRSVAPKGSHKFLDDIHLGTYVLDLGTIVAGSKATRSIAIQNIGASPLSFDIDLRSFKAMGLSLSTTKATRLAPGSELSVAVTLQTKKTFKSGKTFFVVPITAMDGCRYTLEILANINVPELVLSEPQLDFGNVLLGQLKRMYLRVENQKQVPCEWSVQHLSGKYVNKKKQVPRIQMTPMEGLLEPGKTKTIEFAFEPNAEGEFKERFQFSFKDSNRKIDFVCSGAGIVPLLRFQPADVVFDSCLPGETVFKPLSIQNKSAFDVELIMLDYDKDFVHEQNVLRDYDSDNLRVATRGYQEPFWREIAEYVEVKNHNRQIEDEIRSIEKNTELEEEERKRQVLELKKEMRFVAESRTVEVLPIDFKDQVNVLIACKDPSVEANLARFISQEHSKGHVDLNQLVEWHKAKKTEVGELIEMHLAERAIQLEAVLEERKKRKNKKNMEPLDERDYARLTPELLAQAVAERLKDEDCKAGCVVTGLSSSLSTEETILGVLKEYFSASRLFIFEVGPPAPRPEALATESNEESVNVALKESEETDGLLDFVRSHLKHKRMATEQRDIILHSINRVDEFQQPTDQEGGQVALETISDGDHVVYKKLEFPGNVIRLNYSVLRELPVPRFPDKESLPIPQPVVQQLLVRPAAYRQLRQYSLMEVFSYKDLYGEQIADEAPLNTDNYLDKLDPDCTRWLIPANKTIYLCLKYSSDAIKTFKDKLVFGTAANCFNSIVAPWVVPLSGQTIYPDFNRNFVNIFSTRRKTKNKQLAPKKSFIVAEEQFDFGPLLVADRVDFASNRDLYRNNATTLRLTNDSPFPIKLAAKFKEDGPEPVAGVNPKQAQKKKPVKQVEEVFELDRAEMEIEVGATEELTVWALPESEGKFTRVLVCSVVGNPRPMEIPFNCQGVKPTIELDTDLLDFEKLILNKTASRTFTIANPTQVAVAWKLLNAQELEAVDMKLDEYEGTIAPGEKKLVTLTYFALREAKLNCALQIQAEDIDKRGLRGDGIKSIKVTAEGYKISVDFKGLANDEKLALDFGETQVRRPVTRGFSVVNNGIYSVDFEFVFPRKKVQEYFTVEPKGFSLPAGKELPVAVKFMPNDEAIFDDKNTAVLCAKVLERQTSEVFNEVKIGLLAQSQYSRFIINPSAQLNFGPIIFTESRVRTFEVTNKGLFDFRFDLIDFNDKEMRRRIQAEYDEMLEGDSKAKKQQKQAKKPRTDGDKLELGVYSVQPATGTITPGSTATINVTFKGKDSGWYETQLGLNLSNQSPEDANMAYTLIGESCVPCIDTQSFRSIFEEQVVTQSMNTVAVNIHDMIEGNVFSIEDNTFFFGSIIPSKHPNGITEKFKLINKGKVPAQLECSVRQKNDALFAFEVFPKTLKINPHESAYVKIKFLPEIMAVYEGVFEAKVANGKEEHDSCRFVFDVKGEGTLPTLKVLESAVQFGKTRNDKAKRKTIPVKNIGLIPASAVVRLRESMAFRLLSPQERVIMPQETFSFEVEFRPKEERSYSDVLEVKTLMNTYEASEVKLTGEGFFNIVCFEGLENEEDLLSLGDLMVTPSTSKLAKRQFHIKNNSSSTVRFEWEQLEAEYSWMKIQPTAGHIAAGMTKRITLRVAKPETNKSIDINKHLALKVQAIQLSFDSKILKGRNWDSHKKTKRMITKKELDWQQEVEKLQAENKGKAGKAQKVLALPPKPETDPEEVRDIEVFEQVPEPAYEPVDLEPKKLSLEIKGRLDLPDIRCDMADIEFKETEMFATCVCTVKVNNLSTINLQYAWAFYDEYSGVCDKGYFDVQPETGGLPKSTVTEFLVRFTPTESDPSACKRSLFFKVLGTDISHKIELKGNVTRPVCHFELPYMLSEQGERIVEVECVGHATSALRKFYVLNPTALSYDFYWETDNNTLVRCLTPKGTILSGKKFEMQFEFVPNSSCSDTVERRFTFKLNAHSITQNFLIRGTVVQPKVFFSVAKIDFGPLLVDTKNKETVQLRNFDVMPYGFSFLKTSIKGTQPSYYGSLEVAPLTGTVAPGASVPIKLNFGPKVETDYNYNLICNIKGKKEPLTLNIKGIGYKLHHSLTYMGKTLAPQIKQPIAFGQVFVNESRSTSIEIANNGEYNFDFLVNKKMTGALLIHPENGTIKKGEKLTLDVQFQPLKPVKLHNIFEVEIVAGPVYRFDVTGMAMHPQIELRPATINFDSVLVTNYPITIVKELQIINHDKQTLTVECEQPNTNFLDVKLPPGLSILPYDNSPSNVAKVSVVLNLRDIGKFSHTANFVINGNHAIKCAIKGEGVPLALELENPQDINIDYGTLKPLQTSTKTVKLVNNSKVPVQLNFNTGNQLASFFNLGLSVNPSSLYIPQKSAASVEVGFSPKQRISNFDLPLAYEIAESNQQFELLKIKGACFGVELKVVEDSLSFGPVVVNSSLTKKLQLLNLGDVNAEYSWDLGFMDQYFSITPSSGIIMSNDQLFFDVSFAPRSLNNYKLVAKLIVKDLQESIKVKLSGTGVSLPVEAVKTVEFEAGLKGKTTKAIEVPNNSLDVWELFPSITNENYEGSYFSTEKRITVQPQSKGSMTVEYAPLTMLPKPQKATLFLPLKNGMALVYNLIGKTLDPKAENTISLSTKAKSPLNYSITFSNWLNVHQRLETIVKMANEEDPVDSGIVVNTSSVLDVSPLASHNVKLCITAVRKGNYSLKVVLRNPETEDYLFYILNLSVEEAAVIDTLDISSTVRESVNFTVLLDNPLNKDVLIAQENIAFDLGDIKLKSKTPLKLKASNKTGIEFTYRPLIVYNQRQVRLVVSSSDLGEFAYNLVVSSQKTSNIPTISFKGKLGDTSYKAFNFTNYVQKPLQYACQIAKLTHSHETASGQTDFSIETQNFNAPKANSDLGVNCSVNIKYEPSILGVSKGLLTVKNPEGGEFQAYLIGTSEPPLPKGPFKISPKGFSLDFKNPFNETKEFTIRCDNPAFSCSLKSPVKLESKKVVKLNVLYKEAENNTGRLIIETDNSVSWVYYLHGVS